MSQLPGGSLSAGWRSTDYRVNLWLCGKSTRFVHLHLDFRECCQNSEHHTHVFKSARGGEAWKNHEAHKTTDEKHQPTKTSVGKDEGTEIKQTQTCFRFNVTSAACLWGVAVHLSAKVSTVNGELVLTPLSQTDSLVSVHFIHKPLHSFTRCSAKFLLSVCWKSLKSPACLPKAPLTHSASIRRITHVIINSLSWSDLS